MAKATKIIRLVESRRRLEGASVLEVGTGSGVLASELSRRVGPAGRVEAVDVADQRVIADGYRFTRVDGTLLPFPDGEFDLVISNHVIEHVGDEPEQGRHLRELRRVIGPNGLLYLAVPNRWGLLEPHYRLPLLSWLPRGWADHLVRVTDRGEWYDVNLLSRRRLVRLLLEAGWHGDECTVRAMRVMADVEAPRPFVKAVLNAPGWLLRPALAVVPTLVYLAAPAGSTLSLR